MITVRQAQEEHGAQISEITKRTCVFSQEEIECVGELWVEYWTKGAASGYHFLVAEDEGVVTGYACYGHHAVTAGVYDLYWLAVDPDAHHKGSGSALVKRVEDEVRELGGNLLIAETSSTTPYQPARDFYLKYGFIMEATLRDFYSVGDHLEVYTKHLD